MKENTALSTYNPSNVIAICAIFSKFIPLPPDILPIIPLKISVVAFPNILGPTIVNIVLPIANINTTINAILYLAKYEFISFFVVFLKSLGFSVVLGPRIGPPIGPGIYFPPFPFNSSSDN